MSKGGKKQTSTSTNTSTTTPVWPAEAGPVFGRERELLANLLLPMERQRISSLGALSRGDMSGAGTLTGPALSAARQAQARMSSSLGRLPSNVAAPMEAQMAFQAGMVPHQMQAMAPEELAQMVQALVGPQFGGLFAPSQRSTSTTTGDTAGGGPSGMQTGMAAVGTATALAALGVAIA